jgi:low temperature requirement protein LtrA
MTSPATAPDPPARVSTIELFFDLVFVFTITQLTHLVDHAQGALDFLRALLVLTPIWWMYAGYAWLTNDTGTQRQMRLVLIAAMAGFLVMALSIPDVFGANGLAFGLAYLLVIVLHLAGFALRGAHRSTRAILGLAPFNLGAAALVIAAAFMDSEWRWLLFLAASMLFVGSTIFRRERGFSINASHFVERHGLVILIVLGESVVAIGTGAAGRALDARTIGAIVLSLVLVAALWWSYFDRDDERAEQALAAASPEARSRIALFGYWYAHLAMISGIVLIATGLKQAVAHDVAPMYGGTWLLAGGMAVYFCGDALFRWVIGIGPVILRAVGVAMALIVGFVGRTWSGVAELGVMAGMAIVLLAIEQRLEPHRVSERIG